ncbi:hypothetical protein [Pseudomonas sp. TNT3]|uniref:hypothetical protein n=1 Tax=Pseudomonas sp. TNT3 TaxID=2654097 RepID=UPI001391D0D0|nr:hypothetical protein [Pseudomonas sp. TNT3]KAI2693182.1 hypothetical protein GBC55_006480 [Pseudomonas sp. TNT3]
MAGNSLTDIIEKMTAGSIMEKWGAICAFDRERINLILQQQWLKKYEGFNHMPGFSGKMYLNDAQTEEGELTDIVLGTPLLSFEPSVLSNSKAMLTLSILSGTFTAQEKNMGVMYSYAITEAQGYTVTLHLDLSYVKGEVDLFGRVILNISQGTKFSCNLAAPATSQKKLGEFFDERFKALDPERQVYELGMLNLSGVSDLHPDSFKILTQRAPGAAVAGALNAADGAVVVMVKLKGSEHGGDYPSPETFPYLIPDDEENGLKKYSATMVLAREFSGRCEHEKLELIQSLLFPEGKNVFVEHSRFEPHDMVIFGSLDPSKTSLTIEPSVYSLKAGGEPLTYLAYLNGERVAAQWSVKSLNTFASGGEMDPYGRYMPVDADEIGKDVARNIVTATFIDPITRLEYVTSALLLVTAEDMTVSPKSAARRAGGESVTLVATALSGSTLTWSKPVLGDLEVTGNVAIYTPPTTMDPKVPFVTQKISVTNSDGETVTANVVLSAFDATVTINPPFVSTLPRSGVVELSESSAAPPEFERQWSVISGGGSVSTKGVFTAPAGRSSEVNVVQCLIYAQGWLVRAGYSVINNRNHVLEAGWDQLDSFHITSRRGERKLYANGYQQLALDIKLKTRGDVPITLEDLSTLRIFYMDSNQQVVDLPAGQIGVPKGNVKWAQTRVTNDYTPAGSTNVKSLTDNAPAAEDQHVYVYMMARDTTEITKFYAVFYSEGRRYSSLDSTHELRSIELLPERSPPVSFANYTLKRNRIEGGGQSESDQDDDRNFDYFLETLDYWELSFKQPSGKVLKFMTAKPMNKGSHVQWESTFDNERMFSCTGWAFRGMGKKSLPPVMTYSPILKCSTQVGQALKSQINNFNLPEGDLLFSVVRRKDVRQDSAGDFNELKAEGMQFYMTDEEGHQHAIEVKLKPADRNRIQLRTIAPPTL